MLSEMRIVSIIIHVPVIVKIIPKTNEILTTETTRPRNSTSKSSCDTLLRK